MPFGAAPQSDAAPAEESPAAPMSPFAGPAAFDAPTAPASAAEAAPALPPPFSPFGAEEEPVAAAPAEDEGEPLLPPAFAPFDFAPAAEEEEALPDQTSTPDAASEPLPFAPGVGMPAAFGAPAAAAPAVEGSDRDGARARAQKWWETAGQGSDTCEVCSAVLTRGEGYHVDSEAMLTSESYLEFATRMGSMFGMEEDSAREEAIERVKGHAAPWHLCENCLSQHFGA